ncbi:hypothetical protein [Streptomyces sp. NPDC058861]
MTAKLATLTGLALAFFAKAQRDKCLPEIRGLLAGLTFALALLTPTSIN